MKTNAGVTGAVGGYSGQVVCGRTLQALFEATRQISQVLRPAGL